MPDASLPPYHATNGQPHSSRPRNKTSAELTLENVLQDSATRERATQSRQSGSGNPFSDGKPRLLLMGMRRSGKSSISSVVFHKLPPAETLYLETTHAMQKQAMHSFMDFQVWDAPGHIDYLDPTLPHEQIFGNIGALIWVIDAQDEYLDAVERLNNTILALQHKFPSVNIEVFVHKVDGLSEDYKSDIFRDIQQRVLDELADAGYDDAPVFFYQTSIYDQSIFEAFSKVIQKLIPQRGYLENLLNTLVTFCKMEKAYLFDVLSKIYIASDTTPGDISSLETCSDFIDVIVDVSEIYGWERESPSAAGENSNESNDKESNDPIYQDKATDDAEALITLEKRGSKYLYLREINKYLALVCIMGEQDPYPNKAIVDWNVSRFQEGIEMIFDPSRRTADVTLKDLRIQDDAGDQDRSQEGVRST